MNRAEGYSGTPLPRKLGVKAGQLVVLVDEPEGFQERLGGEGANVVRSADPGKSDMVIFFVKRRADLERRFPAFGECVRPAGALWIAWPKRSSGVATDLTEGILRDVILPSGMVDNKVCAIDATWSGLRFVWRRNNR